MFLATPCTLSSCHGWASCRNRVLFRTPARAHAGIRGLREVLHTERQVLPRRHRSGKGTVHVHASMASPVLSATAGAAVKLLLMCSFVGSLVLKGVLPSETAEVFSKVSFNILTPCMLFTRLSRTLVASRGPQLAVLPMLMAAQVMLGLKLGQLLSRWLIHSGPRPRTGWHPAQSAQSAPTIAAAMAAATGVPQAASALSAPSERMGADVKGYRALAAVACGFGNSLTLPMVFLTTLFPASTATTALGYTALLQITWYPLLWSTGYSTLRLGAAQPCRTRVSLGSAVDRETSARLALLNRVGTHKPTGAVAKEKPLTSMTSAIARAVRHAFKRSQAAILRASQLLRNASNPPLLGVLSGLALGCSPLGTLLYRPGQAVSPGLPVEVAATVAATRGMVDVAEILAGAALASQAIVLGASLVGQFANMSSRNAENGQGSTSETVMSGKRHEGGARASANGNGSGKVPMEFATATTRGPGRVLQAGTTHRQTHRLAFRAAAEQLPAAAGALAGRAADAGDADAGSGKRRFAGDRPGPGPGKESSLQQWLSVLVPDSQQEHGLLWVVALTRFLILPAAGLGLVALMGHFGALQGDPLLVFAVLLQLAMPPAQSLALMVQLQPSTKPLAPVAARLLLRLYIVAVLPVTVWVTLFLAVLKINVGAA